MREYNVHEVLAILQKYYITDSQQMVTRWIREGKILAVRGKNRKEGYSISEEDLFEFIEVQRPGLPSVMDVYEEHIKNLNPEHSVEKYELQIKEPEEENVEQLKEHKRKLEAKVLNFEEETKMYEVKLQELTEQNDQLHEYTDTCNELFNMVEEENNQLKSLINQSNTKQDINNKKVTFKKFEQLTSDHILKLNIKMNQTELAERLQDIYEYIFDDGLVKEEFMRENGEFKCPYTNKAYKQQKRFLNNTVKYYFNELDDKQEKQNTEK